MAQFLRLNKSVGGVSFSSARLLCGILLLAVVSLVAQAAPKPSGTNAELLTKENIVDISAASRQWQAAVVGQSLALHDRLRTGEDSRATLRLSDLSVLRVDELTNLEILPPRNSEAKPTLDLHQGSTYFFSREAAREVNIRTPAANGAIRGTEFTVTVASDGRTSVTMLDGELQLSNAQGTILVRSGERGDVIPGQRPTKTAVIEAINTVQWCLYYPGVLDLNEIRMPASERETLAASLRAYDEGDLLVALEKFPRGYVPVSPAANVYRATLLLSVGQVQKAELLLRSVPPGNGGDALRILIAAVTLKNRPGTSLSRSATDWLAESYYRQSVGDLKGALQAAEQATSSDPSFGFAWTRRAELEFSFGKIPQAKKLVEQGLHLSPRNPAAHALLGFLFSAQNDVRSAKGSFEQAMAIDGALGDAWLGRGLCFIRQGKGDLGRRDLQTAAALEPNRSIFHSYLGKAFSNVGSEGKANLELDRAKRLDPKDPTPWIYSAIEKKQENRLNEAVDDLEKSVELNDNRRVYRSEFLLDQDRAVRSANLAAIYQDDGMVDVSVREAARGVDYDYSNASSHLFLANSYNALRDPNRINLRYETPWFNELLLSNLLAPVGGGPLSQYVSEQEYSKLFEADRLGISSTSTYLSSGAIRETASQFGIYGNFSYSLDTEFFYDNGLRPNNEITRSESYGQIKLQVTPQDSFFLQTKYQDVRTGDVLQYYSQDRFQPGFHFRDLQQPAILLLGYHHEWAPGWHTLVLVGRLEDETFDTNLNRLRDISEFLGNGVRPLPNISLGLIVGRNPDGSLHFVTPLPMDLHYHNAFTTYTGELNQIWEQPGNTLVAGCRFQSGEFHTSDQFDNFPSFIPPNGFAPTAVMHDFNNDFSRASGYIYDTWRPFSRLSITGGFSYDDVTYPTDHRNPPIVRGSSSRSQVSPKAGLIWNPFGNLIVRAAYTRALGGVSFDESVQLEPTEVAGFNQVFRSIISESVVGAVAAPRYENAGILIEDRLNTRTYLGITGTVLKSKVDTDVGVFDARLNNAGAIIPPITSASTSQQLRYEEENVKATVNQLIGDDWSFGASYSVSYSNLENTFANLNLAAHQKATLHEGELFALYNHPSGLFLRGETYWARQSNIGYRPDIPGDELIQLNLYAGYRFRRNYGDVTLGFLNITDDDYKLNPLNYYNEFPRQRTLLVRVRFNF